MTAELDSEFQRNTRALGTILKSQYHAVLAMLRECIEQCPEDLWHDDRPTNAFWQNAYHVLFFAHFYLQPTSDDFRPWERHQSDVQHPDGIPGPPDPSSSLPLIPRPYSKADAIDYWKVCDDMVDAAVDRLDLWSTESGFSWYPIPKLEHQIVNLRHIQHHAAQLADRLRAAKNTGIRWVGARRPE